MSIDVRTLEAADTSISRGTYQLDTMDHNTNIGRLVYRARHVLVTYVDSALAPLGLTATQWMVVVYLTEGLAAASTELSHLLRYDPDTVARLIDRLGKKDIVKRTLSDVDHRSMVVSLTEQDRVPYPEIRPLVIDVLNHLLCGFSQTKVKQLENLLLHVLYNVRSDQAFSGGRS